MYMSIHRCKTLRVASTYPENGNAICLEIVTEEGKSEITFYDLPETISTVLAQSLGDAETICYGSKPTTRCRYCEGVAHPMDLNARGICEACEMEGP
jgi:hypothetical protein